MQSSCFRMHVLALPRGMWPINLTQAVGYAVLRLHYTESVPYIISTTTCYRAFFSLNLTSC